MSALGETQDRIASIRKLRAVVGAMRGIAATHLQHARAAQAGYQAFAETVEAGLASAVQLLADDPPADGRGGPAATAVVAFAAEHGFAGAFSGRVLDSLEAGSGEVLFLVGARGAAAAERKALRPYWTAPMASQAEAVAATARRAADALYTGFLEQRFARAEVVFSRMPDGPGPAVARRRLLPLDLTRFQGRRDRVAPLANLAPRRLVERLVGEYVFAELARAALESFASENAARLAAMEAARLNIDQKLESLSGLERLLRQEEITAEVQDVVAGALAAQGAEAPAGIR